MVIKDSDNRVKFVGNLFVVLLGERGLSKQREEELKNQGL
jgi:hypothetical protein